MPARILLALDTPDLSLALGQTRAAGEAVDGVKLGLEFFLANGPAGVLAIGALGRPVFLDLKFHDIPNTVAGAVRSALRLKPMMLNVHAGGGPAMLRAAAEAVRGAGEGRPLLIAVTVLTSLADEDLAAVGQGASAAGQARRLAALARAEGCDGVVCAGSDIAAIRADCGPDFKLVVPGLRPAGATVEDQKRVMTPGEVARLGADFLVIGRPITSAADPAAAARAIRRDIGSDGAAGR
ncbi:MAG TPA: orotidine-5'-phosphate decarboxylase [Candidatus Udaeobacter sp.]|nr:orotidine-5'-phosphate decarboxylase [Candidatus Udaeobacter sp.]